MEGSKEARHFSFPGQPELEVCSCSHYGQEHRRRGFGTPVGYRGSASDAPRAPIYGNEINRLSSAPNKRSGRILPGHRLIVASLHQVRRGRSLFVMRARLS